MILIAGLWRGSFVADIILIFSLVPNLRLGTEQTQRSMISNERRVTHAFSKLGLGAIEEILDRQRSPRFEIAATIEYLVSGDQTCVNSECS